jgi:phosphatidate phosphatase APP1
LPQLTVIDIDDTIKQSYVRDRIKLLRYTFVFPPTPVDGQPALYDSFTKTFSSPAFFYLSASPYSLYQMLHPFVQKYFPPGQILLRNMTWQELESFITSLTVGTQDYKQMQLDKLMGWFPKRKWVFIGDSTQTDPEAYAYAYKKNPENVKRIWIRVVKGVDPEAEKSLNSEERFQKAFEGVPASVWKRFEDPRVLHAEAAKVAHEG